MRPFRLLCAVLVLVTLAGVATIPGVDFLRGAALVVRAAGMHGPAADRLARFDATTFVTEELQVPSRSGPIRARLYRPVRGQSRTIVLTPGVHAEGIDEPRLTKFAGDLAASGAGIVTPELPDLLHYEITRRLADQIEDVARWVASDRSLSPDGRVGLVGISFSGGLSLIAAGRSPLREHTAFVLSFGGHGDLGRVMRFLATGTQPDGTFRQPHDYGVVVELLNFAYRLAPPEHVDILKSAVRIFMKASHVDMFDKAEARRIFDRALAAEADLPSPARALMHMVNTRDVRNLGALLAPIVTNMELPPEVSPERSPAPGAPIYLLHGADDVVIPSQESELLAASYRERGAHVQLLVTPLITHAEVDRPPTAREALELVRFWMRMLRE